MAATVDPAGALEIHRLVAVKALTKKELVQAIVGTPNDSNRMLESLSRNSHEEVGFSSNDPHQTMTVMYNSDVVSGLKQRAEVSHYSA